MRGHTSSVYKQHRTCIPSIGWYYTFWNAFCTAQKMVMAIIVSKTRERAKTTSLKRPNRLSNEPTQTHANYIIHMFAFQCPNHFSLIHIQIPSTHTHSFTHAPHRTMQSILEHSSHKTCTEKKVNKTPT